MHLPDEFLNNQAAFSAGMASLGALAVSLKKVAAEVKVKVAVLQQKFAMGNGTGEGSKSFSLALSQKLRDMLLLWTVIVLVQMVDFPVLHGTTAHFLGAALATAVVGPFAAILVMGAVITFQAVALADGGIAAIGANLLTIGITPVIVAYLSIWTGQKLSTRPWMRWLAAAMAGWSSVVAAALTYTALTTWFALPTVQASSTSMIEVHLLVGLGESLMTIIGMRLFFAKRTTQES